MGRVCAAHLQVALARGDMRGSPATVGVVRGAVNLNPPNEQLIDGSGVPLHGCQVRSGPTGRAVGRDQRARYDQAARHLAVPRICRIVQCCAHEELSKDSLG